MSIRYIHYGSDKFEPSLFLDLTKNITGYNKPTGGLWASRLDDTEGWYNFASIDLDDAFDLSTSFTFTLSKNANIVTLTNYKDFEALPKVHDKILEDAGINSSKYIDFEKLRYDMHVDALEVFYYGQPSMNDDFEGLSVDKLDNNVLKKTLHYNLYGWDCNCIIIFNKDIIIPD